MSNEHSCSDRILCGLYCSPDTGGRGANTAQWLVDNAPPNTATVRARPPGSPNPRNYCALMAAPPTPFVLKWGHWRWYSCPPPPNTHLLPTKPWCVAGTNWVDP